MGARSHPLSTTFSEYRWSSQNNLPTVGQLADGAYLITAVVHDKSGNIGSTAVSITIDKAPPAVIKFTTPLNNDVIKAISTIQGTAGDNAVGSTDGSGLQSVTWAMKDSSTGRWWNGSGWDASPTALATTLVGRNWTATGWPSGPALSNGAYQLTATAYDKAGNGSTASILITVDSKAPTSVTFTTPRNGTTISQLASIQGMAADNPTGKGIDQVRLYMQRSSDSLWWDGSQWSSDPTALPTNFAAGVWTTSSILSDLPTGADLPDGTYNLTAIAYDKAGNGSPASLPGASITVTVDTTSSVLISFMVSRAGATLSNLPVISGTATENGAGNNVRTVTWALQRVSDSKWWDGTQWAAASAPLPAQFNSATTQWSSNTGFSSSPLADGSYRLVVTAQDQAGNAFSASTTLAIDRTAKAAITFTSPAPGAAVTSLPVVTGTANDSTGGSVLSRIDLNLRDANGKSWDGIAWSTIPATLRANYDSGNWTVNADLPTNANLPSGVYTLTASALDSAGNSTSVSNAITVDRENPISLTFTNPLNGAALSSFLSLEGTVEDNPGGSGIDRVTLTLQRVTDTKWWNGITWVDAAAPLTARVLGTIWHYQTGLPGGDELPDGQYQITATAIDKAGKFITRAIGVVVDTKPPAATFTTPINASNIKFLPTITGRAEDNAGGSGIRRVALLIQRTNDRLWWNGSLWATASTELKTTYANRVWTCTGKVPTDAALPAGNYVLLARAYDKSGNMTTATISINVAAATIGPATITFNVPSPGATLLSLPAVGGTAVDTAGGSGIRSVTWAVQRAADGLFWSGTAWQEAPKSLMAPFSPNANKWASATGLSGPNLRDGGYLLSVTAVDRTGNATDALCTFTIDRTAPIFLNFTAPTRNGILRALSTVAGTAYDNATGSGIRYVRWTLRSVAMNKYWTGSTWITASTNPASINLTSTYSAGIWANSSALPSGNDLPDGKYELAAFAYDQAGKSKYAMIPIKIDAAAPVEVSFTTPTDGKAISSFSVINGEAKDNPSGTGINKVDLLLKRGDGKYWTGPAWKDGAAILKATVRGTLWNYNTTLAGNGLPTGGDLPDGDYELTATAYDFANNPLDKVIDITVDKTRPTSVAFTTPVANERITTLPSVKITAADNPGGSGLASIALLIQRARDGFFWSGSEWKRDQTILPMTLTGADWVNGGSLPSGGDLEQGFYTLSATAVDRANNRTTAGISVRVVASTAVAMGTASSMGRFSIVSAPATNGN